MNFIFFDVAGPDVLSSIARQKIRRNDFTVESFLERWPPSSCVIPPRGFDFRDICTEVTK